jgi:hypothetical protein
MHNMCVSDRVMDGNVYAVYDPRHNIDGQEEHILEDLVTILGDNDDNNRERENGVARIGLANSDNEFVLQHMLARQSNWKALNDKNEHARLHSALL